MPYEERLGSRRRHFRSDHQNPAADSGQIRVFSGRRNAPGLDIHYLQVIGEAANRLSKALKDRYPEVPWPQITALRNILVHEYFGLNMKQVWMVTQRDLPELEKHVRQILIDLSSR